MTTLQQTPVRTDMLEKVTRTIKDHNMIQKGDKVLVALSGGADSVALLLALNKLCRRLRFSLAVAHLNHRLRGEDADADEVFAGKLAERLELPFTSQHRV